MADVSGRVVVITGAVGNLGVASARAFLAAGAHVVLVDRLEERLHKTYPDLSDSPHVLFVGEVDLTNSATLDHLVERTLKRFGRIDALVNTVGTFRAGKTVYEENLETWDFLIAVNVKTVVLACRAVVPAMLRNKQGSIITVGSISALAGGAEMGAYSASKAALQRVTESLAREVGPSGIRVNCVMPGTIDTPQNRQAIPAESHHTFVDPAAIADVIVFLASPAARAINGVSIPVPGR